MPLFDFDASPNLVALFLARADEMGDKPFLWAKREGHWQAMSWAEAARTVCLLAQGLRGPVSYTHLTLPTIYSV